MNEEAIKSAVSDVMSDFYNEVMKKQFETIHLELRDLRLTNEALVKIVDYSKLEAKVVDLEDRLKKLEESR